MGNFPNSVTPEEGVRKMGWEPTFDTRLPRVGRIKSIVSLTQDGKNYLMPLFHVQNKPPLPFE